LSVHNLATVYSAELEGVDARLIEVEVDLNVGLHAFNIVGLADKALNEAKERVNSALKNSGVKPPNRENRRITINLAPADIKKSGSQYDLALALGYLVATQQIAPFETKNKIFVGELALDGRVRPVAGALSIAEMAGRVGFQEVYVPEENAREAVVVKNVSVIPVSDLRSLILHLENKSVLSPPIFKEEVGERIYTIDFSEIKGQENAKRALTIAAAGGHNILSIRPQLLISSLFVI
jgi:magnesium chelatase family protein